MIFLISIYSTLESFRQQCSGQKDCLKLTPTPLLNFIGRFVDAFNNKNDIAKIEKKSNFKRRLQDGAGVSFGRVHFSSSRGFSGRVQFLRGGGARPVIKRPSFPPLFLAFFLICQVFLVPLSSTLGRRWIV